LTLRFFVNEDWQLPVCSVSNERWHHLESTSDIDIYSASA